MKDNFFVYLKLQLKRVGKLIPFVAAVTLLIFACVYLLGDMVIDIEENGEHKQKMKIGVVGETDDMYVNLAVSALQNMDVSRFAISFERMEESQAQSLLKKGRLNAYIVIPDGFVTAALYGENEPITYVTTDGAIGIGTLVMDEVAEVVSDMVLQSQNSVFAMQRYAREEGLDADIVRLTDEISERYVIKILEREKLYEFNTVGYSHGISFIGYYICAIAVLFLLVWGMSCAPLFVNRDLSLSAVFAARGQKVWKQILAEYFAYFAMMTASVLCVAIIAAAALELTGYAIPEWENAGYEEVIAFFADALPVVAMISAMQFLLYEIASGTVSGIFLQFLTAIGLGYISGCLYPINFFPESIRRMGAVLPSGTGRVYLEKSMMSVERVEEFAVLMIWAVLFIALSTVIRKKKIS